MNTQNKYTAEQHNAIIDAIRATLDKLKHHQSFGHGTKFGNALRAALGDAYTVYVGTEYSLAKISVHGAGCDYNNRIYLCWNVACRDNERTWTVELEKEINRRDERDCQEREIQEQTLDVDLSKIELRVRALKQQIAVAQAEAFNLIAGLPAPKSATLRNEARYWRSPSTRLATQFPNAFGK